MSAEANKRVVRRHYEEVFNERRLDVAAELTSPDYVEHGLAAVQLFRVVDGKCVEHSAVRDDLWLLQQLGVLRIEQA